MIKRRDRQTDRDTMIHTCIRESEKKNCEDLYTVTIINTQGANQNVERDLASNFFNTTHGYFKRRTPLLYQHVSNMYTRQVIILVRSSFKLSIFNRERERYYDMHA